MGVKNVERDGLGARILTDLLTHGIVCYGNQAMFQSKPRPLRVLKKADKLLKEWTPNPISYACG